MSACRPAWWGFDPSIRDVTPQAVGNALDALAPRIAAIGELICAASENEGTGLPNDTMLGICDILCDYAKQAEALSRAIERRAREQMAAAKAAEPKRDKLARLRKSVTDGTSILSHVAKMHVESVRKDHAAVIAEIEAGERDEGDRAEADRLRAAALAASGKEGGEVEA